MKEMIEKQMHELVIMAYKAGYEDGKDEAYKSPVPTQDAYNNGLHDAWECVKKIDDMSLEDLRPIFSTDDIGWIAKTFSAAEVISRIKEYEENIQADDEIKIGDEVVYVGGGINHNSKGVVIGVHENWAEVRFKTSWNCVGVHIDTLRKTYRHFPQIEEVIQAIKGGEKE